VTAISSVVNLDGTAIYLTMASLFIASAWAVTNFSGNAVATVIIGKWVGELDQARARVVLSGGDPFDEATMLDDTEPPPLAEHPVHPAPPARPEVAAQPTPV
jgi:aerobic C4-dicarboxylate transport protein